MNMLHPSLVLKQEWTELIRANAPKAEKERRLTKKQLDLIFTQDWFRLLVPTVYGGKQTAYPEVLQLIEALAWADGSMSWIVGICSAAGWHGAFINPEVANVIFNEEKAVLSCCRAATGTAEKVKGGYKINGKWQHASGAIDATTIIGCCVVTEKGKPVSGENNKQLTLAFPFFKKEISILPTWKSMGMIATSSDGFEVKDLVVPENRAFKMGENQKVKGKLYHFPYLQFLEAGLAANISGMTYHFINLCKELFATRKTPEGVLLSEDRVVQGDLDRLTRKFETAREKLFYGVSILWQSCVESKPLYPSVLNKVSSATDSLTRIARETVNELYPYCGLKVTETDSELNRVWRDFQTASQHNLLVFGGD